MDFVWAFCWFLSNLWYGFFRIIFYHFRLTFCIVIQCLGVSISKKKKKNSKTKTINPMFVVNLVYDIILFKNKICSRRFFLSLERNWNLYLSLIIYPQVMVASQNVTRNILLIYVRKNRATTTCIYKPIL